MNMGLVECPDVGVGFDFFSSFSDANSYVCNPLFPQGCQYLLFGCQRQLPIPDNSFEIVEFFIRIGTFCCMEDFHFQYVFCLSPALHHDKQVSVLSFLNVFRSSSTFYNFFYEERAEFG